MKKNRIIHSFAIGIGALLIVAQDSSAENTDTNQNPGLQVTNVNGTVSAGTLTMEQIEKGLSLFFDVKILKDTDVNKVLQAHQQAAVATQYADFVEKTLDTLQAQIVTLQAKKDLSPAEKKTLEDNRKAEAAWLKLQVAFADSEKNAQANLTKVVEVAKSGEARTAAADLADMNVTLKNNKLVESNTNVNNSQADLASINKGFAALEKGELSEFEKAELDKRYEKLVKNIEDPKNKVDLGEFEATEAGQKYLAAKVQAYVNKRNSDEQLRLASIKAASDNAKKNVESKEADIQQTKRDYEAYMCSPPSCTRGADGGYLYAAALLDPTISDPETAHNAAYIKRMTDWKKANPIKAGHMTYLKNYWFYTSPFGVNDWSSEEVKRQKREVHQAEQDALYFPEKKLAVEAETKYKTELANSRSVELPNLGLKVVAKDVAIANAKAKTKDLEKQIVAQEAELAKDKKELALAQADAEKIRTEVGNKNYVAGAKLTLIKEKFVLEGLEKSIEEEAKKVGKTKDQYLTDLEADQSDEGRFKLRSYQLQKQIVDKATWLVAAVDQSTGQLKDRTRTAVPALVPSNDGTTIVIAGGPTVTPTTTTTNTNIPSGPTVTKPVIDPIADASSSKAKFNLTSRKE